MRDRRIIRLGAQLLPLFILFIYTFLTPTYANDGEFVSGPGNFYELQVEPYATYSIWWKQASTKNRVLVGINDGVASVKLTDYSCEPFSDSSFVGFKCHYLFVPLGDRISFMVLTGHQDPVYYDFTYVSDPPCSKRPLQRQCPSISPSITSSPETTTPSPTLPSPSESSSFISPEPTLPTPTVSEPSVGPSPIPSTVGPSPSDVLPPTLLPTTAAPLPTPDMTEPAPSETPSDLNGDSSVTQITLSNGVVLSIGVAKSLKIFDSPQKFVASIFVHPGKTLKALSNVGADLPPKVRKKAQKVVISAIIVVQVVGNAVSAVLQRVRT